MPDQPQRPDPFEGPDWTDSPEPGSSDPAARGRRIRRRTRRSRRRRRRRIAWIAGAGLAVLVALTIGWLAYTGLQARSELQAVRAGAHQLEAQVSAGHLTAARATTAALQRHADRARQDTSGPAWAVAAAIPLLGDPFDTARVLSRSADVIARQAVPPVMSALDALKPPAGHPADGALNLRPLLAALPRVDAAGRQLAAAEHDVQRSPASTWLGPVDSARRELLAQLQPLTARVHRLATDARIVPALLGQHGTKRYMVVFENDAEIRPTGGLPGAFAVLQAEHGTVRFTQFLPDDYLIGAQARGVNFGFDFNFLYQGSTADFRDSDASPDFPKTAQIWSAMWADKTGQHLDGVLALDPTALSYLLAATGPVTLPDGSHVSAGNVVQLTQQEVYARYPAPDQNAGRKAYLLDIARAVSQQLFRAHPDLAGLLRAGTRGADEHRLLFYSTDPAVQKHLASGAIGGVLPRGKQRYVAVTLNNESQSKLEYYLHSSVDYVSTGCGPTRTVTMTVRLTNHAPATGLPPYVLGASSPPATELLLVGAYGSEGARFDKVTVNGQQSFERWGKDNDHPARLVYATVHPGQTSTVVFRWTEPAGTGPLQVRDQPMVNPMSFHVTEPHCPAS